MAKIDNITVGINLEIPSETIKKCAAVMQMDKHLSEGDIVTVIHKGINYTGYHVIRRITPIKNKKYEIVLERLGDL